MSRNRKWGAYQDANWCSARQQIGALFSHVVDLLAAGRQPDIQMIDQVGYLFRTTASMAPAAHADRAHWSARPTRSFQPEMLAVWLIRAFSVDIAEHVAQAKPHRPPYLLTAIRRRLGIGNSTGLGMAPFLINHPQLINSWISARETALARVRAVTAASEAELQRFRDLARRAAGNADDWDVEDERQAARILSLRQDFDWIIACADTLASDEDRPWDAMYRDAEKAFSTEGQEALVSLMFAPYPILSMALPPACMPKKAWRSTAAWWSPMLAALNAHYDWTDQIDFNTKTAQARVWYVSEEKLEPRLGERQEDR